MYYIILYQSNINIIICVYCVYNLVTLYEYIISESIPSKNLAKCQIFFTNLKKYFTFLAFFHNLFLNQKK